MGRATKQADRDDGGGVLMRALMPLAFLLLGARLALPAAIAMIETHDAPPEPAVVVPAVGAGEQSAEERAESDSAAAAILERFDPLG